MSAPAVAPVSLPPSRNVQRDCAAILELLLPHRRGAEPDSDDPVAAFGHQLDQLGAFVSAAEPILFSLPAFSCKSPNPAKVLGHLPDEGERLSLRFLDRLCVSIQERYEPGARVLICSDGHVFADLIGVLDDHVDAYNDELSAIIHGEGLDRLDTFDLRDVFGAASCDEKRAELHGCFAPSVECLRAEMRTDEDTLRLYRGITRFLVEDTAEWDGSRSALQRQCRQRAYGVIQRSRAWGTLIAHRYPRSVRLSIHPQRRGSAKFGIRLLEVHDAWTTPWHSVVLRHPDGTCELLRRADAERLGALVLRDGRPSHYQAACP